MLPRLIKINTPSRTYKYAQTCAANSAKINTRTAKHAQRLPFVVVVVYVTYRARAAYILFVLVVRGDPRGGGARINREEKIIKRNNNFDRNFKNFDKN